ncbi:hypothetical protein WR25_10682 [Diploscapter pachys]|uniref:Uncharacterized protein n=1 Tax=Diploscapter pachys TaxID=2018661 RepID=A0A2A2LJD4_9BILA|nr:hypothetical protein WR25_10682 [Diploscapter pachys]
MVINGKSQAGYTPIATELSPPLGMDGRVDSVTQPLLPRNQVNGNGYQPLNGAVIPNGNGMNGIRNGGSAISSTLPKVNGNSNPKKKDFKEWYV